MESKKHYHKDKCGVIWEIYLEQIPKNKGSYRYWIGETLDKKIAVKGDSMKGVKEIIDGLNMEAKQKSPVEYLFSFIVRSCSFTDGIPDDWSAAYREALQMEKNLKK